MEKLIALQVALMDGLAALYAADEWAPSITTSRIDRGYYVSLIRYQRASEKQVVVKWIDDDFGAALVAVATAWAVACPNKEAREAVQAAVDACTDP